MSSISALVNECSEPGRLDRMSGNDTRPCTSAGVGPCAISFWIASSITACLLKLRCSARACKIWNIGSGSSIVALMSDSVAPLTWFRECHGRMVGQSESGTRRNRPPSPTGSGAMAGGVPLAGKRGIRADQGGFQIRAPKT